LNGSGLALASESPAGGSDSAEGGAVAAAGVSSC
jgi:hypothetical protein